MKTKNKSIDIQKQFNKNVIKQQMGIRLFFL